MSEAAPQVSVKLTAGLVNQARDAASTMRRSVSSQIEYWATLGKALEHAGLTTGDSHVLIARQEQAAYLVRSDPAGSDPARNPVRLPAELDALHGHVLALAKSGALNERTRDVVRSNRALVPKAGKARKAA